MTDALPPAQLPATATSPGHGPPSDAPARRGPTPEVPPGRAGVVVDGLYKGFGGRHVLRGVDLDVPEGSITAILGPSGAGKTTLLRVLAGFERPERGTVTIGGTAVDGPGVHLAPGSRRVGYVPQEGSLFPHLDVRTNVGFGLPRSRRRPRVNELLEMTGLTGLAGRYPHQLSGGEQQRVALARALAPEPALVLLDEPFSSLDAFLRASVRLDVARILARAGTTTVIVTHDQAEALSMADQVAVFRDGRVAQADRPDAVYGRPSDAALARFVGEANLFGGTVRSGRVDTPLGRLDLLEGLSPAPEEGSTVQVMIRPEQIELDPVACGTTGGAIDGIAAGGAGIAGVVVQRDYHGHDSLVSVDASAAGLPEPISVRCAGPAIVTRGQAVTLRAHGAVVVWPVPQQP